MTPDLEREYGQIAVKNNFLTSEQLQDCHQLKESLRAKYGKEYGLEDLLIEKGYLSDVQVQVVRKVLKRKIDGSPTTQIRPALSKETSKTERNTERKKKQPVSKATSKSGSDAKLALVEEEIDVGGPSSGEREFAKGSRVRCHYCNQQNQLGLSHCTKCGHVLPQPGGAVSARAVQARPKGPGGAGRGFWIAVGGFVLVAGVVLAVVLFSGSGGGDRSGSQTDGGGAAVLSEREVADLEERFGGGREAEADEKPQIAWDRYRWSERKAAELLRIARIDDPLRARLEGVHRESEEAALRVVGERGQALDQEIVRAQEYLSQGDLGEAREVATSAIEEARRWKDLLAREGVRNDAFERVVDEGEGILDRAQEGGESGHPTPPTGEVAVWIEEFETLARNLLSIQDAQTWRRRGRDHERLEELRAKLVERLGSADPRVERILGEADVVQRRAAELLLGREGGGETPSAPREGLAAWFPAEGPWLLASGGESVSAEALGAELAGLLSNDEAAKIDPEFFAACAEAGVGILFDKKGRAHRGVLEEKETVYIVTAGGKRHTVMKDQVAEVRMGTTYLSQAAPESVRDRLGQPIPGRPTKVDGPFVAFEGEGAPAVGVDLAEVYPEDAYALLQAFVLEKGKAASHLALGKKCLALGLEDEAREEYLEAVRIDPASLVAGLPIFHPEALYSALDARADLDASLRFRLAIWSRVAFERSERFLDGVRKAMALDPEKYGGAWMHLALAVWLYGEKRFPEALEEISRATALEGAPAEARDRAADLAQLLEKDRGSWEADRDRRLTIEISEAVLDSLRALVRARAKSPGVWHEDRNWARERLLDQVTQEIGKAKKLEPASVRAIWESRLALSSEDWPARKAQIADEAWLAEPPGVLNIVHSADEVVRLQGEDYGEMDAERRAGLLEFLFLRTNASAVSLSEKPCARCRGKCRIATEEEYRQAFGAQFAKLCKGCRGIGSSFTLEYR